MQIARASTAEPGKIGTLFEIVSQPTTVPMPGALDTLKLLRSTMHTHEPRWDLLAEGARVRMQTEPITDVNAMIELGKKRRAAGVNLNVTFTVRGKCLLGSCSSTS